MATRVCVKPFFHLLGKWYVRTGRYGEAEACFRRAVRIDPTSFSSRLQLGRVYFLMREFYEAEKQFLKAQELDPKRFHKNRLPEDYACWDVMDRHEFDSIFGEFENEGSIYSFGDDGIGEVHDTTDSDLAETGLTETGAHDRRTDRKRRANDGRRDDSFSDAGLRGSAGGGFESAGEPADSSPFDDAPRDDDVYFADLGDADLPDGGLGGDGIGKGAFGDLGDFTGDDQTDPLFDDSLFSRPLGGDADAHAADSFSEAAFDDALEREGGSDVSRFGAKARFQGDFSSYAEWKRFQGLPPINRAELDAVDWDQIISKL